MVRCIDEGVDGCTVGWPVKWMDDNDNDVRSQGYIGCVPRVRSVPCLRFFIFLSEDLL